MGWTKEEEATGKWKEGLEVKSEKFRYIESNLYPVLCPEVVFLEFNTSVVEGGNYLEVADLEFNFNITDFELRTTKIELPLSEDSDVNFSVSVSDFELKATKIDLPIIEESAVNFSFEVTEFKLPVVLVATTQTEVGTPEFSAVLSDFELR